MPWLHSFILALAQNGGDQGNRRLVGPQSQKSNCGHPTCGSYYTGWVIPAPGYSKYIILLAWSIKGGSIIPTTHTERGSSSHLAMETKWLTRPAVEPWLFYQGPHILQNKPKSSTRARTSQCCNLAGHYPDLSWCSELLDLSLRTPLDQITYRAHRNTARCPPVLQSERTSPAAALQLYYPATHPENITASICLSGVCKLYIP